MKTKVFGDRNKTLIFSNQDCDNISKHYFQTHWGLGIII